MVTKLTDEHVQGLWGASISHTNRFYDVVGDCSGEEESDVSKVNQNI